MVGEFILQVLVLKKSRCTRCLLKKLIIPSVSSEATAVKRVITRHLVHSLVKMEPSTSTDAKAVQELTDKLISRFTNLKNQVTEVDQVIIPLLENKLPTAWTP